MLLVEVFDDVEGDTGLELAGLNQPVKIAEVAEDEVVMGPILPRRLGARGPAFKANEARQSEVLQGGIGTATHIQDAGAARQRGAQLEHHEDLGWIKPRPPQF